MMEPVSTPEISATFYEITRRNIPQHFHTRRPQKSELSHKNRLKFQPFYLP
jgi:hypothetical protein